MSKYYILNKSFFINGATGCFANNENELNGYISKSFNFDLFRPPYSEYNPTSVTFCINLSDACNLGCDYCFNPNKQNKSIDNDATLTFLDTCFKTFPNKEKYYVDLSGKGEPLLFLDKILKIKRYCEEKSNELNREVLVQLVSNGTLLNPIIIDILQKNGILFGVSLDGNELIHDKHRKSKGGKNTYQMIIDNVNNILHHEYVGAACTLTNDVFSLKDSLIELSKTFNTVSYKPSRDCFCAIDNNSINKWLDSYDDLVKFLTEQTIRGNLKYIRVLLNGEDYLGKYIKRIILGQRNIVRCDAGIGRFTLDTDNNVYACPASFSYKELKVGTKDDLDFDKSSKLFNKQIYKDGCQKCDFRNICGGECQIEKLLSKGINKIMCEYKKHLILLAIYFVMEVGEHNLLSFDELHKFCIEIDNRRKLDKDLDKFLKEHKEYNFIEGKKKYDEQEKKY